MQAMSGIISTTGWDDGPPVAVGAYMADVAGALTAAYGVLTALYARSQYGIGQEIEVSLLDSMIAFQAMETVSFLNSNILPRKSGSGPWLLPQPYGIYHTKDKDLAVNAHSNDLGAVSHPGLCASRHRPTPGPPAGRLNIAPSSPRPCKRFYAPKPAKSGWDTWANTMCYAPRSTITRSCSPTRRSITTRW